VVGWRVLYSTNSSSSRFRSLQATTIPTPSVHRHLKHFQALVFRPLPFERSKGPAGCWLVAGLWLVRWLVVVGWVAHPREERESTARYPSSPAPRSPGLRFANIALHTHTTTVTSSRQSTDTLSRQKTADFPSHSSKLRKQAGKVPVVKDEKGLGWFSREHFGADVELAAVSGGERAVERAERVAPLLPCHTRELL